MSASWRELDWREFGDWPLTCRAAACALSALLALALPWMLLTRQTVTERQVLAADERDLQVRLIKTRQQLDACLPLSADSAAAADHPPLHLPELMLAMHEAAAAAGVRTGQFRPGTAIVADTGTQAQTPIIELRLSGTWAQLIRFAQTLAAPGTEAILGVQEIGLRAEASAAQLELTARVRIYPRPLAHVIARSAPSVEVPGPNPFAHSSTRAYRSGVQTVIGSIRSGHRQAGLALGEDGQLRQIASSSRPHLQRREP